MAIQADARSPRTSAGQCGPQRDLSGRGSPFASSTRPVAAHGTWGSNEATSILRHNGMKPRTTSELSTCDSPHLTRTFARNPMSTEVESHGSSRAEATVCGVATGPLDGSLLCGSRRRRPGNAIYESLEAACLSCKGFGVAKTSPPRLSCKRPNLI